MANLVAIVFPDQHRAAEVMATLHRAQLLRDRPVGRDVL
jgi:hypothetical protein